MKRICGKNTSLKTIFSYIRDVNKPRRLGTCTMILCSHKLVSKKGITDSCNSKMNLNSTLLTSHFLNKYRM